MAQGEKSTGFAEHLPSGNGQLLLPSRSDEPNLGSAAAGHALRRITRRGESLIVTSMALCGHPEGNMQAKLRRAARPTWLLQLFIGAGLCAILAGLGGVSVANAQGTYPVTATQPVRTGGGPYYIEFRSRYAWDYGHTFMIFGQVGQRITRANVAGLSPVGDDPTAWVVGHYVPVPAETGATDGDLEEKYVSARFRVTMNKGDFDRTVAYIRHLQATSHTWSAELYNCNAFAGDVARFMGLRVPGSSLIYPKVYVSNLRKINTGHPEAAETLVSDNVKEMQSPTRDGRAMINSGVHTVRADAENRPAPAASTGPRVTIGPVRVSTAAGGSAAASER
jgi:hypothetical protein